MARPSQITSTPEGDAIVVRVRGPLTSGSAARLRRHLLQAVAELPASVVCDLRKTVITARGLTVLLTARDQFDDACAICPLIVLADDPHTREQMCAVGLDSRVELGHRPATATTATAASHRARQQLTAHPTAAGEARRFVRGHLEEWGLHALADDAVLIVDELVANGVRHAGTDLTVILCSTDDRVRIAVADTGGLPFRPPKQRQGRPGFPHADSGRESGRGLTLVAGYSTTWGHTARRPVGNIVWAVLGARPGVSTTGASRS